MVLKLTFQRRLVEAGEKPITVSGLLLCSCIGDVIATSQVVRCLVYQISSIQYTVSYFVMSFISSNFGDQNNFVSITDCSLFYSFTYFYTFFSLSFYGVYSISSSPKDVNLYANTIDFLIAAHF